MKTLWITAFAGLCLVSTMDLASAQRGGRDYGCEEREDDVRGYDGERGRGGDRNEDGRRLERRRDYDDGRDGERSRGYDERSRDRRYDDEDRGMERRRGSAEERDAAFDEDEYLRCNPDVRKAVENGAMKSAEFHYRKFGRREGRRLTCETKL